ncbi:hypothetical protein A0H81_14065 [Grifola frondosa]|uniref:Uncharacterized protein n=1 Tax=Grifola frondosa TaxID=5627 RepID=A0A1C7LMF0_GRIFR|nr:hypothetical protein A0H81_14065 [Grifola frondosa]
MCYTGGSNGPPPDIKRKTKKGKRHVKEYEDKSDDELSSKGIKWMDVTAPAIEVLEQQEQFHEEKRTRQQFGRDLRRAVSQKWRLVVSYKPYVL